MTNFIQTNEIHSNYVIIVMNLDNSDDFNQSDNFHQSDQFHQGDDFHPNNEFLSE